MSCRPTLRQASANAVVRPLAVASAVGAYFLLTGLFSPADLSHRTDAGELSVTVPNAPAELTVGVIRRWDADGNPLRPVNPKARIDSPELTAVARKLGADSWHFDKLAPGRYDLVLLTKGRVRIEGFTFVPVLEFDAWMAPDARPTPEVWEKVRADIAGSRHYENKVVPLFQAGDEKKIRVFMQLVRDEATSFDAEFGQPVATIRHEVWQFTNQYGGWVKEKRTRVFDRALVAKAELQQWTWVWDPRLGGIEIAARPVKFNYPWPKSSTSEALRGLTRDGK